MVFFVITSPKTDDTEHEVEVLDLLLNRIDKYKEKIYFLESEKTSEAVARSIKLHPRSTDDGEIEKKEEEEEKMEIPVNALIRRDVELKKKIDFLQREIQKVSLRELKSRYGEGPAKIGIHVSFPSSKKSNFTIELASPSLMPHSTLAFLEYVRLGLYSGSAFYLNAPHVLQGGPGSNTTLKQAFHDHHRVSFREYSLEYPHKKYTLGFVGHALDGTAGPDFYLNKIDNTRNHGPETEEEEENLNDDQGELIVPEVIKRGVKVKEPDPCFAKVIDGLEVVDEIFQLVPLDEEEEDGWFAQEEALTIIEKLVIL